MGPPVPCGHSSMVVRMLALIGVLTMLSSPVVGNPGSAEVLPSNGISLYSSVNDSSPVWYSLHVSSDQPVGVVAKFNPSQGFLRMRGYLGCNVTACGPAAFSSVFTSSGGGTGWNSISLAVASTQVIHVEVYLSEPVTANSSGLAFSISTFHQGSSTRATLVQAGLPVSGNISLYGGYQAYRIIVPIGRLTANLTILGAAASTDRVFGQLFPEGSCNNAKPFCDGASGAVVTSTGAGSHVDSYDIFGGNTMHIFRLWAVQYSSSQLSSLSYTLTLTTSSLSSPSPGATAAVSSTQDGDPSSDALSSGAIAGIVVGTIVGVGAIIAGFLFFKRNPTSAPAGRVPGNDNSGAQGSVVIQMT